MGELWFGVVLCGGSGRSNVEADENLLDIRQITDDALERFGQMADQRRDGDDLVTLRQRRILHQINDRDRVTPRQMRLADLLEIAHRRHRFRCLARDVEPEIVAIGYVGHFTISRVLGASRPPLRFSAMALRSAERRCSRAAASTLSNSESASCA